MGKWRYSAYAFLTSALDGGKWSVPRPGRFTAGTQRIDAGWAPEPIWTLRGREKFPALVGKRTPSFNYKLLIARKF